MLKEIHHCNSRKFFGLIATTVSIVATSCQQPSRDERKIRILIHEPFHHNIDQIVERCRVTNAAHMPAAGRTLAVGHILAVDHMQAAADHSLPAAGQVVVGLLAGYIQFADNNQLAVAAEDKKLGAAAAEDNQIAVADRVVPGLVVGLVASLGFACHNHNLANNSANMHS